MLREVEKLLKKQPARKTKGETHPPWVLRARQIVDCLNEPLDMDKESVFLDIPPPVPMLKQADSPIMLSAGSRPEAGTRKRPSDAPESVAPPKRAHSDVHSSRPPEGVTLTNNELSAEVLSSSSTSTLGTRSMYSSEDFHSVLKAPSAPASQQLQLPANLVSASIPTTPAPNSRICVAYTEIVHSLSDLIALVTSSSSPESISSTPTPQTFTRTIRPLRGCVARLELLLSGPDRTVLVEALAMLEKLLEETHRECALLGHEVREKADRAMYDLKGAALDLKDACRDVSVLSEA